MYGPTLKTEIKHEKQRIPDNKLFDRRGQGITSNQGDFKATQPTMKNPALKPVCLIERINCL